MSNNVVGIVASPNKAGRTNELVQAALKGAAAAGAQTELVQMSEHVVLACKDCLPWVCATNLKCTYKDEAFEFLSQKITGCGALVFGTPVYWGDTSAMARYLFIKLCRVHARAGTFQGLPAVGIAIAGGSGNGLTSGLKPVYHVFRALQMRAIEPVPATRFDFDRCLRQAEAAGERMARMAGARQPFKTSEECWLWYDQLPHIWQDRTAERRLLASITYEAVPAEQRQRIEGSLARADILQAAGQELEALNEISRVYNSCLKLLGPPQR